MADVLQLFNGVKIRVLDFELSCNGHRSNIKFSFMLNDKTYKILFFNVSQVYLEDISFPFIISGFTIDDNQQRGWEKHSLYTVSDYEDGKIRFYCEKILLV